MQFRITIIGETAGASDLRIAREILALLNSTAATIPALPTVTAPQNENDDDTPNIVPVAAAPQPVPTLPSTAVAAAMSYPGVDRDGFPWDERIHASTGTKNADGTWRGRRNLDAAVKAQVEAELRARGAVSVAAPQLPPPPTAATPAAAIPAPPALSAPPPMPVPVAAPQPVPIPTPAPAEQFTVTFENILSLIDKAVDAGKMNAESILAIVAELQVADLSALMDNPSLQLQTYQIIARNGWYVA